MREAPSFLATSEASMLSSSLLVTATTRSAFPTPALRSTWESEALPSTVWTSRFEASLRILRASRSTRVTLWASLVRNLVRWEPTSPAPMTTMFTSDLPWGASAERDILRGPHRCTKHCCPAARPCIKCSPAWPPEPASPVTHRSSSMNPIRPSAQALLAVLLFSASSPAQVAAGTLYQSIDTAQNPGVNQVLLPGNPSITTNEVIAWGAGEGPGRARSLLNFQGLATMLGDRDGDSVPFDWRDIDALEVGFYPSGESPTVYDFRFSLSVPVLDGTGMAVISPGDVFSFTGVGGFTKVITEAAFTAALGTTTAVDVDAYCELPSGAVLISVASQGVGSNIVHPLSGFPGTVNFSAADTFIIRPPFGSLPAILAWRGSELDSLTPYVGYTLTDVVGLGTQPATSPVANPWDPLNLYQAGTRPHILWTVFGDENVLCSNAAANPLGNHNFWCIVSGSTGAGYSTNTSNPRVFADALAIGDQVIPVDSRVTLDPSALFVSPGSNVSFTFRSPAPAGTVFQAVVATQTGSGLGLHLGPLGFEYLVLDPTDPLLFWTATSQPLAALFTTGPADNAGTAVTPSIPVDPGTPPMTLYLQGFRHGSGTLSTPLAVRIN